MGGLRAFGLVAILSKVLGPALDLAKCAESRRMRVKEKPFK
jgi:hypothetical protein